MTDKFDFLYNDELTVLKLRSLYENCGFKKYRMGKFESYDFYAKNKDFLVGNRIITFSDLNGKLMALKPDVTLSIVKNADASGETQKLYYTENVYRESKDIREFKEISQVGLEVLGDIDLFGTYEVVYLAVKSLIEIDKNAILEISHMGYTEGLIDCISDDRATRNELHELLSGKNAHDLLRLAAKNSFPESPVNTAVGIMSSMASNEDCLAFASANSLNKKMADAVAEVKNIYTMLKKSGLEKHIKLDFSVAGDPGYYNGIIMHGYVNRVPRAVLSGGRYDMLMRKMRRKEMGAMGFAIYFDALDRMLHTRTERSASYILYDEYSDSEVMISLINDLQSRGEAYTVVKKLPESLHNAKIYKIGSTAFEEVVL